MRSRLTSSLVAQGVPPGQAASEAARASESQGGGAISAIPHFARLDFAFSIRSVLYAMAAIMAAAAVVALVGLRAGVQEETDQVAADPGVPAAG
ncbi:MAG: hypothetical protein ACLQPH_16675 [Acidimicrobiales bacterium]